MATTLTSWHEDIVHSVPGCPNFVITKALRETAIDFCEDTLLWYTDLDRITMVDGTNSYALSVAAGLQGQIAVIQSVKFKTNGTADSTFTEIPPTTLLEMAATKVANWEFETADAPTYYYLDVDDNLILYPIPSAGSTSGLLLKVNLRPTETATSVADFLFTRHRRLIMQGAKAKLLSMVGVPWTDDAKAAENMQQYEIAKGMEKDERYTGYFNRNLQVGMK